MQTQQLSARHQELLDLFEAHFETERVNDVEACLKTVSDDIVYEHPFRKHEDPLIEGREAVREYYIRHWGAQPFQKIEVRRSWLSGDDTLIVEVETTVGRPGETPRTAMTFAIGVFRDGLLAKEITMSGPFEPVG
jgi:predicted SnoaL-like aldol condensation-catalyzing enzyme